MTELEIIKVIRCGETSTVQFKQRFTSAKQIAEEFVAFANSKGGRLIFGVEDKTGKILGLAYDEIQSASRELGNIANDLGGMEYRDSKDIEGTIPEMFEQGMMFLKLNLHQVQAGQNFNSVGKLEVSQVALEEILQNALVHREYIKTAPIRLLIFDNRVEIISPGALADGLTEDDIKLGITFQRNQLIAGFCAKTMLYRGLGSGLLRAHKDGAKMQFINSESGKQFTTVIYRDTTLMGEDST